MTSQKQPEERAASDQQENSNDPLPTIPIEQDSQQEGVLDGRPSSLVLVLKARSKFSLEDLVNIKPGTLLITGGELGKTVWDGMTTFAKSVISTIDTIGYQWFSTQFVRSKKFYYLDMSTQTPEEAMKSIMSYHWTIRTNQMTYDANCLEHGFRHKYKDEVVGMVLGNLIVGTRGNADSVVLMKILAPDDVGWICFVKNPNETFLELQ
jgi:hypothetical protein